MVGSSLNNSFMNLVRERDGECVIIGYRFDGYIGLEAAHIFPLAHGTHWTQNDFGRWITDDTGASINSVQNGILLRSDVHKLFELLAFDINPDVW